MLPFLCVGVLVGVRFYAIAEPVALPEPVVLPEPVAISEPVDLPGCLCRQHDTQ